MTAFRIMGPRLDLVPLPPTAAAVLPGDRAEAARLIGSGLPDEWPHDVLLDVLPMQASAAPADELFGVWLLVERETNTVVGDIGFLGPPDLGEVEIGFSVIPDRRRRGYATEAARLLVDWALVQPSVNTVIARSDADNHASARVLMEAGFRRTATSSAQVHWRRVRD